MVVGLILNWVVKMKGDPLMEWQVDLKDEELSPQLQVVKEGGPWEEQQGGDKQ